jgi:hypothetical protein
LWSPSPRALCPSTCQSAVISTDDEIRPDQPWLRIESGEKRGLVEPMEAVRIRDGLRRTGGPTQEQLATIIDAKATELLASPLYVGTLRLRIDTHEEECLRDLLTSWVEDGTVSELETGRLWQLWGDLGGVAVE